MEYPRRKHVRLKDYDYSRAGMYFVTICTKRRQCILSKIVVPRGGDANTVGRDDLGAPSVQVTLTPVGKIAERYLNTVSEAYPGVTVEHKVIMPNHVHILLWFHETEGRRAGSSRPTQLLPRIIAAWKRFTNRDAGYNLWQSSYHEHVIRDENDLLRHWSYIDQNPARWAEDEYFTETP